MLPFDQLPHRLIVEIAYNTVFWINCFPHKDGIHNNTISPWTIVKGSKIFYQTPQTTIRDICVDEFPEDSDITINNIKIIEQMNTAQINNEPMTGEEAIENNQGWTTVSSNNRYNLRPKPTKETISILYCKTVNNQLQWQYWSHMHTSWWPKWAYKRA